MWCCKNISLVLVKYKSLRATFFSMHWLTTCNSWKGLLLLDNVDMWLRYTSLVETQVLLNNSQRKREGGRKVKCKTCFVLKFLLSAKAIEGEWNKRTSIKSQEWIINLLLFNYSQQVSWTIGQVHRLLSNDFSSKVLINLFCRNSTLDFELEF